MRVSRGSFTTMYWTVAQLVTHHASNGCNLRPGDLLASGTVSGPTPESRGCLLERTWRGTEPLKLPTGEDARFLEDGDEVMMRGWCERAGAGGSASASVAGGIVGAEAEDRSIGPSVRSVLAGLELRHHSGWRLHRLLGERLHEQLLADPDSVALEVIERAELIGRRVEGARDGRQRLAALDRVVPLTPPFIDRCCASASRRARRSSRRCQPTRAGWRIVLQLRRAAESTLAAVAPAGSRASTDGSRGVVDLERASEKKKVRVGVDRDRACRPATRAHRTSAARRGG